MAKKNIKDLNLKGKKVLMRVDFNVPMKGGVITDDNRIVQALPTIRYALEQGGKVILFSHLGRIKTEEDLAKNSLALVAKRLEELLGKHVEFVPVTRGKVLEDAVAALKEGEVLMFENTRYEDLDGKKNLKMILNLVHIGQVLGMFLSMMLLVLLIEPMLLIKELQVISLMIQQQVSYLKKKLNLLVVQLIIL